MADLIKVGAIGGLDEDGRDCYFVEINDDIFIIDYGTSLPDKNIPGVDFMLPNPQYIIKNKNRIKGYFITHGHDESMAGLKFIYNNVPAPIYCSEDTKNCLESQAKIFGFKVKFNFVVVKPTDTIKVANREVRFFQTCHNAPGSSGIAILTDKGYIVFSSDYIVDFDCKKGYFFDLKALEDIAQKPIFLLMGESKGALHSGYCAPKHNMKKLVRSYFRDDHKRIFITCFWQNIFRLHEIFELCKENKKKLYLYNEYARKVVNEIYDKDTRFSSVEIVSKEDLLRVKKEDVVVLILGHGDELYDEIKKLANRENTDKRLVIEKDDIFINAALPRPTIETACTRAMDDVYRSGCEVRWLKKNELIAMHAKEDDIKFLLYLLKPKFYLPVRGNYTSMIANAKIAVSLGIGLNHMNVFIIDNGMAVSFNETGRPTILNDQATGIVSTPLLVDGLGYSLVDGGLIADRNRLSQDGVVVIAATISTKEKKIVSGPDCQMRGFVYLKEAEPLLKSISSIFNEEVTIALRESFFNDAEVKAKIEERIRRFIKRENGREPYILPIINVLK